MQRWPLFVLLSVLMLALVAFMATLYVNLRDEPERSRRNSLAQIGLSLYHYADYFDGYPAAVQRNAAGRPMSSWRVTILPFMRMGYNMPQAERWDDPTNRWRSMAPFEDYCFRDDLPDRRRLHTNVVAITGKGTAFDDNRQPKFKFPPSSTIVAIEVADSGVHWMEPGDLLIDEITPAIMKGLHGDGLHVICASGQVYFISADAPFADVKKFFTIDGGLKYNIEKVLEGHISK